MLAINYFNGILLPFACAAAVIVSVGVLLMSIDTAIWTARIKHKTKVTCEHIKQNTKYSMNKIAGMTPSDLEAYLTKIFSLTLELASAEFISERDPNGRKNLYKTALAQFIQYLGDSYDAIEYYYGEGYVINWFSLQYRLLDYHGEIDKIVHKTQRYNAANK